MMTPKTLNPVEEEMLLMAHVRREVLKHLGQAGLRAIPYTGTYRDSIMACRGLIQGYMRFYMDNGD